jgi:glycoprotein endo-alpha-1,2-mannosidase
MAVDPEIISITSYNEWGEGTQIEGAIPFTTVSGEKLPDYGDHDPDFYMHLTREFATLFKRDTATGKSTVVLSDKPADEL